MLNELIKFELITTCLFFSLLSSQSNLSPPTKLYEINGTKYISALDYAKIHNIPIIYYEDKQKLELRYKNYKLIISPHSSFIRFNDDIFHMYTPVVYDGNDFYIPINPFLEILNNTDLPDILLDSSEKFFLTNELQYNVNNLSVINKVNGSIIQIKTSIPFTKDVLAASITSGGWLNLTIAGALVDSIGIVDSQIINPVVRIRTVQMENSSVATRAGESFFRDLGGFTATSCRG